MPIRSPLARRVTYAASAWTLTFAAAHYYWAFGGTWLRSAEKRRASYKLLAQNPWYYWISWLTLSTAFVLEGLFSLALAYAQSGNFPRWLRFAVIWGTCEGLLLLAASLFASDLPLWAPLVFVSWAAGLVWVVLCYSTVPPWALLSATFIVVLGMTLYSALGIRRLSVWGAWWFLGGVLFVTAAAWCNTYWGQPDRLDGAT